MVISLDVSFLLALLRGLEGPLLLAFFYFILFSLSILLNEQIPLANIVKPFIRLRLSKCILLNVEDKIDFLTYYDNRFSKQ